MICRKQKITRRYARHCCQSCQKLLKRGQIGHISADRLVYYENTDGSQKELPVMFCSKVCCLKYQTPEQITRREKDRQTFRKWELSINKVLANL